MLDTENLSSMRIGERIKRARISASLRQRDVAQLIKKNLGLKIGRATISLWESGKIKEISAKNLLAASMVLNVNPYWIIFGTEI
jgi:transcriptional regulator with XRE-family HTH domain